MDHGGSTKQGQHHAFGSEWRLAAGHIGAKQGDGSPGEVAVGNGIGWTVGPVELREGVQLNWASRGTVPATPQFIRRSAKIVSATARLAVTRSAWSWDFAGSCSAGMVSAHAHRAVGDAIAAGQPALDPALLAGLRERCDQAVHWGEIASRHRDWDDAKNHPGYVLARRRKAKAEQVWLVTRHFAVPWARKRQRAGHQGPKRHQAVCGCWHAPDTLSRYYRVRTYLVSIRDHGIPPIDAIHAALTGRPWLPIPVSA